MANETEPDSFLIKAAQQGDETALKKILLVVVPILEVHVKHKTASSDQRVVDHDDVMQEVLIAIHQNIGQFEISDTGGFNAWCRKIADNRIVDSVRHAKRLKRGGDLKRVESETDSPIDHATRGTTPSIHFIRKENRENLDDALDQLPDNQKKAIRMRYLDQRNNGSIARSLGVTVQAIDGLLKRGKKKLVNVLDYIFGNRNKKSPPRDEP